VCFVFQKTRDVRLIFDVLLRKPTNSDLPNPRNFQSEMRFNYGDERHTDRTSHTIMGNNMRFILALCSLAAMPLMTTNAAGGDEDSPEPITIARPFLWEIHHSDAEDIPSWLFGTIHVPDEQLTTLHPVAQKAFDASQAAYFEIDFMQNMSAQLKAISLPDDQSLDDLLPPELLSQLDARIKKMSPAMSRDVLPAAHVGVWPLLLGNMEAQVRNLGQFPLDLKLYMAAKQEGKRVGGLEKPDGQLEGIIQLPLADQIRFLQATLDGMDEDDSAGIDRLDQTMRKYASGDEQEFAEFIEAEMKRIKLPEELTNRIMSTLLSGRNAKMADSIDRLVSESPETSFFFAVGLGHLTGKETVQDFLRKKGFTIQRTAVESDTSGDNE
jgi:uncharacterized protein